MVASGQGNVYVNLQDQSELLRIRVLDRSSAMLQQKPSCRGLPRRFLVKVRLEQVAS